MRHALPAKTIAVLFSLAAALFGQEAPSDPAVLLRVESQQRLKWATEWLNSDNPQRIAWGAWLARQDHQFALIPSLIKKVEEYQPNDNFSYATTERDDHDAMLAVLDALIGLGAAVPAE